METEPKPPEDLERRLGELLLSLAIPGRAVYIDIYPMDPEHPDEYTYEYWEASLNGE